MYTRRLTTVVIALHVSVGCFHAGVVLCGRGSGWCGTHFSSVPDNVGQKLEHPKQNNTLLTLRLVDREATDVGLRDRGRYFFDSQHLGPSSSPKI